MVWTSHGQCNLSSLRHDIPHSSGVGRFIIFWDGELQKLADKGGIGILINIAILVALLILRWPSLGF
ncbi:MAG: hypothetical protein IBX40_09365 [Methanosarcinales archaeon]|nr:hypothetical protein [Methanosarcinales archaeon]